MLDLRFELRALRLPVQQLASPVCMRNQDRWIASAPRPEFRSYWFAGYSPRYVDDGFH